MAEGKQPMQASGNEQGKPKADGADPAETGARGTQGESGGGAYPNPHSGQSRYEQGRLSRPWRPERDRLSWAGQAGRRADRRQRSFGALNPGRGGKEPKVVDGGKDDRPHQPFPEGLADDHLRGDSGFRRHASPLSILILGALLLAAMLGLLAGGKAQVRAAEGPAGRLEVKTPAAVRNGVFFETRMTVTARAAIKEPTIAVSASLWRDLTINSQFPDPKEQGYKDGAYTFTYEAMQPGDTLEIKIDGQVNPPLTLGNRGSVALLDGERMIASLPIEMKVLP